MLVFYLPIIIFEAMLEAQANHGSVEPKCVRKDRMRDVRTHLNALGRREMTSFDQRLANEARRPTRGGIRGGLYAWEFKKRSRSLKVRVDGQLVFNNSQCG